MKPICGFKTTDGKFWETEDKAVKHQKELDDYDRAFKNKVEAVRRLVSSRGYRTFLKRVFVDLSAEEVAKMITQGGNYSDESYSRYFRTEIEKKGFDYNEFRVVKECQKIVEFFIAHKLDLGLIKDLI